MSDNRSSAEERLKSILKSKKGEGGGGKVDVPPPSSHKPAASSSPKKQHKQVKLAAAPTRTAVGKAMVIEPNKRVAITIQNMAKTRKLDGQVFENGMSALEALDTFKPLVIFVPKDLPDISGFNLCTKIRAKENGRDACIIVTGEEHDPTMKDQVLMVDANGYMAKPVSTADFNEIMDEFEKENSSGK